GGLTGLGGRSCQFAELPQRFRDILELPWLGDEHGQTKAAQALDDARAVAALAGDHQVWLQRQQAFVIDAVVAADLRQAAGLLGIITIAAHADEMLPGTRREQQFGDMRREADDAGCRGFELYGLAA